MALTVPGLAIALVTIVAIVRAHAHIDWLQFPLSLGGALMAVAGIGLLRGTRWGYRAPVAAAVAWALLGAVLGALGLPIVGSMLLALNAAGPILLCVGAAGVMRKSLPVAAEAASIRDG